MKPQSSPPTTIDEYIGGFPPEIQAVLEQVRAAVRETAPEARETIAYQLPTFVLHGNLVHFGAFKKHIGLYPTPTGLEQFKDDLAPYKCAKGSVQFPLDQPMPLDLIRKIVAFRVEENLKRTANKPTARTRSNRRAVGTSTDTDSA